MKIHLSENQQQIILFGLIFSLEMSIALFFDTTVEWDAKTRVLMGWWWYASVKGPDLVQWLPFIGAQVVWLPLFQWLIGIITILTNYPSFETMYIIGESISAMASAGTGLHVHNILRKIFKFSYSQAMGGIAILLTHGFWLAMGSQAMTEALSIFLLTGTVYHLSYFSHSDSGVNRHLILATLLASLNNLLRYEPWVYNFSLGVIILLLQLQYVTKSGLIIPKSNLKLKSVVGFIIIPTAISSIWLIHNYIKTGQIFYPVNWILENNQGRGFVFNTKYDPIYSILSILLGLSISSMLWIFLFIVFVYSFLKSDTDFHSQFLHSKKRYFMLFQSGLGIQTLALNFTLLFLGISSGWARHFLYLVPFISISTLILYLKTSPFQKKIVLIVIGINLLVGIAIICYLHELHLVMTITDSEYIVS